MRGSAMPNHSRNPGRVTVGGVDDRARGERLRHVAQREVRRREHDAQRIRHAGPAVCVAASIIATRRPVSVASISVCPGNA